MVAGPAGDDGDERERCNQNSSTGQDEEHVGAAWNRDVGNVCLMRACHKSGRKRVQELYITV